MLRSACLLAALLLSLGEQCAIAEEARPVSFELDVQPILTARGCNQGACHGKSRGQNGFQLSLLGFDSDFDYAQLTQQARGRRVFLSSPERSLLLLKATSQLPHGGGLRIDKNGDDYRVLLSWIQQAARRRLANEPKLERVVVSPDQRYMKPAEEQQLSVTAFYSDGSQRDVTARSAYQSSEAAIV